MLILLLADLCHFLDLCRRHCHCHLHPRDCQRWPQKCQLCLWRRGDQFWLDPWLVLVHWIVARCLRHLGYWHDHFVSPPLQPWNTVADFATPSMCEEVREPATQVPKAMVGTIFLNMACGFVFLVPLVFVLPPIEDVLAASSPVPYILKISIGNDGGAFALTVPILVLSILCGTCCTTASSRATWAFARDGAIPGSTWWKQVNHKLDVPFNAMMLCMAIEIILGVIYFGSVAAFNAFSGSGVIFLVSHFHICLPSRPCTHSLTLVQTISYTMPILVSLLTGRKSLAQGHYDFGIFGVICNCVAIGKFWIATSDDHVLFPRLT